jgi:hypothetical protein
MICIPSIVDCCAFTASIKTDLCFDSELSVETTSWTITPNFLEGFILLLFL